MLSIAPEHKLRGMLFWLMGDLFAVRHAVDRTGRACRGALHHCPSPANSTCWRVVTTPRRSLGVDVRRLRYSIYAIASLVTAMAVTSAGSDRLRRPDRAASRPLAIGNDQRLLLPASVLAGGALLTSPTRWRAPLLRHSSYRSAC